MSWTLYRCKNSDGFLWIWILLSVHHDFLGSEGLQGTHIDAPRPFSSKLMTLSQSGGLWTFSANLALCVPLWVTFHLCILDIQYANMVWDYINYQNFVAQLFKQSISVQKFVLIGIYFFFIYFCFTYWICKKISTV